MKRIIASALAMICACAVFSACGDGTDEGNEGPRAKNEVYLSGFEDYYEIQKLSWGIFVGGVSLNAEKKYVCEGEGSARLFLDYEAEPPTDYNDNDGGKAFSETTKVQFGFPTGLFDPAVRDIGNVDSFNISVFNPNERNIDLIFAVKDDGKKIAFSDGRSLEAGKWSHISFDVKPYFFNQSLAVSEYLLYVYDDEAASAKDMALYFDNCLIKTTKNKTPDVGTAAAGELLAFDGAADNGLFLTATTTNTYPAFYAAYTDREIFEGQKGCLMATVRPGINWQYDVNPGNNGYDIRILDSLVKERAKNASSVSVDCRNDGVSDLYVSIIVTSATKTASVKELVGAKTQRAVKLEDLSALGGEPIEGVTLKIDNWNLVCTYHVYFRNLNVAA